MKTDVRRFLRGQETKLLVLVPHRDTRLPLRAWSRALLAAGLPGAWSFPRVAPLAVAERPLSAAELADLARALREQARAPGGRFAAGPTALAPLPQGPFGGPVFAFGPSLNAALPCGLAEDGLRPVLPVVLGAALVAGPPPEGLPAPPPLFFRAAALAVMRVRRLPGENAGGIPSVEWLLESPRWLPR